jgi:type III restriction enzyme
MAQKLQFRFDANQDYQLEAIQAVVDIFQSLPKQDAKQLLSGEIVSNMPLYSDISESLMSGNTTLVQKRNKTFDPFKNFELDEGFVLEGLGNEIVRAPHFTIEMETGTGKTYTYLRTMYELHKHYGFMKFIIIVPSIAIFQGVVKAFETMGAHFRALYDGVEIGKTEYEGNQLGKLNGYATVPLPECLIMTLDSFNKASNVFYRASEKLPGERLPYQYVQETRPIVIMDEPQNMESEKSKEAIRTLHPLFVLRYSATHKTSPNLLYRLTPFEAFKRGLVKRIEVDAVMEQDDFNQAYIALKEITQPPNIRAIVRANVLENGQTRETDIALKHGDNLQAKTGREEHLGYVVVEINAAYGYLRFDNGVQMTLSDQNDAPRREEIFRAQIRATIRRHFEQQAKLQDRGVKVLSLFFVDRVASYTASDGIIRCLFDEEFERLKKNFPYFARYRADEVRKAYFAQMKKPKEDELEAVDTTGRNAEERKAEKAAFELIMKNKEQLLSFDEPAAFIFAHSALKEGWDNPNVFQICTLQHSHSETERRQRIGRGLRLCVNQDGERLLDEFSNTLTVIANESFGEYVAGLQREYREDGIGLADTPPVPTRARRSEAIRRDEHFTSDEFKRFWESLSRRTRYHIKIDTPKLIELCAERLNNTTFPEPQLVVESGRYVQTRMTIEVQEIIGTDALLNIRWENTNGQTGSLEKVTCRRGDSLAKKSNNQALRNYKVLEIKPNAVIFENEIVVYLKTSHNFEVEVVGQTPVQRTLLEPERSYPVFNLIDRTVRETGLTRPTVNAIFKALKDTVKSKLLKNPEGFANVFIATIHGALADHVADHLEFEVLEDSQYPNLEELFPPKREYPQKELIEAGERGIYDMVQKDSDIEVRFVRERLQQDDAVLFYFKFPPQFKVSLPRIIGNYNPDWGIVRRASDGTTTLHLVRETKGSPDKARLQFPQEGRKITSAEKHFEALQLDYRHVTPDMPDWWQPAKSTRRFNELD